MHLWHIIFNMQKEGNKAKQKCERRKGIVEAEKEREKKKVIQCCDDTQMLWQLLPHSAIFPAFVDNIRSRLIHIIQTRLTKLNSIYIYNYNSWKIWNINLVELAKKRNPANLNTFHMRTLCGVIFNPWWNSWSNYVSMSLTFENLLNWWLI